MNEFYAVYRLSDGEFQWKGSGPEGSAKLQELGEGNGVLVMPLSAWLPLPNNGNIGAVAATNLAPLKAVVKAMIDAQAGEVRSQFITITKGQDASYLNKSIEARAWLADNAAPVLGLENEARLRGMAVADLVAEVMARVNAWAPLDGVIEGLRLRAKENIGDAANIGGIVDAAAVDWSGELAAVSA